MQIKSALTDRTPLLRSSASLNKVDAPAETAVAVENAPVDAVSPESVGPLSGDAGQRIGHFVRSMTHESLQHVQYLAGASAFRNVGSTLGSIAFTPLAIKLASENAAIVGGVAIGGTVAAGAIGGLLGYMWLRSRESDPNEPTEAAGKTSVFGKVKDTALDLAAGFEALPKFVYPSIGGATEAQRQVIYNALDQLPLEDATASATMSVIPNLVDTGISGMSQPGASHVRILLDSSYLDNADRGRDLVFHENGHAVDYSGGFGLLGSHNWKGHFGKGPFVSEYASHNRYEDWADTYEHYHKDPAAISAGFPGKAEVLAQVNEQTPLSQAIDTKKVRDAGKSIGEAIGKVPYLRDGLELAGSLVGPVQVYRGAGDLLKGLETDNGELKLKGKLNLASGLFLTLPGGSPLALASSVAGAVLKTTSSEDKPEELANANKWADRVLTTSAGPVGMVIGALSGELKANGLEFDESHGFSALGWQSAKATKANMLKGTIATVGGAVGGSLAGAAIGAALGGRTGAAVGGLWGQVAGGVIGLGVYGASRALRQDRMDKNPLSLQGADKKFLAGMVGGALVGGGVGTGLGTYGGKALGGLVGGLVAGPSGASLLATVGGWSGALLGAYGGAKLGAGLGTGRLLGKTYEDAPVSTLARPETVAKAQAEKDAANASSAS